MPHSVSSSNQNTRLREANERIVTLAKERILEGLERCSVEKMADVKTLQELSDACIKQNLGMDEESGITPISDPLSDVLSELRTRKPTKKRTSKTKTSAHKKPLLSRAV